MKTLPLSGTGIEVSALCMGSTNYGSKLGPEESAALLDAYTEAGGRFLDTANNYSAWAPGCSGGEAETVIGRWMKERNNRSEMFVATKVGFPYEGVERGLSARRIEEECEKSLRRLGIDTIDLYYAHRDDRDTPLDETLEAFDNLVQQGKVRFIGASNYLAWRLAHADAVSKEGAISSFCCIQQRYSYLRPKPGASFEPQIAANDDLLDYCSDRGMTLLAYSPLLHGAYTREDRKLPEQYQGQDSTARLAVLQEVAKELGVTPNQAVFAWMLHSDPPVLPILGVSTQEQLQENLQAQEVTLSEEQMQRLNEASA